LELGLRGSATNLPDGRLQVIVEGPPDRCEALMTLLRGGTTPGSVALVVSRKSETRGEVGFMER